MKLRNVERSMLLYLDWAGEVHISDVYLVVKAVHSGNWEALIHLKKLGPIDRFRPSNWPLECQIRLVSLTSLGRQVVDEQKKAGWYLADFRSGK